MNVAKLQLLFIQGGGDDGYNDDKAMVASLRQELDEKYTIHYPELISDESLPDFGWLDQIGTEISNSKDDMIIVAHSLGASMLLKYLTEHTSSKRIAGIFLIAAPFWNGQEKWQKGLMLQNNFADKLPANVPLFFYQAKDDEEVPLIQFEQYKAKIKYAQFRELEQGGHQLNNDLKVVADDILSFHDYDYWP